VAEGTERGSSGDPKGSLADKRKGASGAPPASSSAGHAGGHAATSSGNGSFRPPQASVTGLGARAVAGATSSASSSAGSVIPPPAADIGKGATPASSPANLDILAERYAALAGEATFSADDAVDRQIAGLEDWCRTAIWRERRDLIRFWVLRSIAFVGTTVASAAPFVPGAPPHLPLVAGTLAVVALATDSAWPETADRVSRHRAIRELRELQHTLRLRWDKVRLAHPERFSPKRIAHALALLDAAQAKREEIGGYLTDSSPGV